MYLLIIVVLSFQALQALESTQKIHIISVQEGNKLCTFRSRANLSIYSDQLKKVVFNNSDTIDLFQIEPKISEIHNKSKPWYISHRGKIGFFTGIGIISLPLLILFKFFPSLYR